MSNDKKLFIITKDDVIVKNVERFHNITADEFIKDYFDSCANILEDASNANIFYAELMADKYGIVVIITNNNFASMYIPSIYNDYQLEQIKSFNDMVKDFNVDNVKFSLVPKYKHNVYYDVDEFLKYNDNKKR